MKTVSTTIITALLCSTLLHAEGKGVVETEISPVEIPVAQRPLYDYMGLKAGTLGVGIEYAMPLNRNFFVRFNLNGLKLDTDKTKEQINYAVEIGLLSAGVLIDYYPMDTGSFRLSAGAYYNGNTLDASASPDATVNYDVGGSIYTGAQIGQLDGSVEFPALAPYIGIGYGGGESHKGWGFSIDIGVLYHTSSDVELKVSSPLATLDPAAFSQLERDIEQERQETEDDLEDFPFYPVVMLGVTYTF